MLNAIMSVSSPGRGLGNESPPPGCFKNQFCDFPKSTQKVGGGGGEGGCCHYKRLNCFLYVLIALRNPLNSKRPSLYKNVDCVLIHKINGCCNTIH